MNNLWILTSMVMADPNPEGSILTSEDSADSAIGTTTQADGANPTGQDVQPQQPKPTWMSFLPIVLLFVIMYMFLFRGPRKKQQEHAKMVESLKKNDRVQTIGGIFGTVIDIKGDEITLKVDEANNTKIKVCRSAIGKPISDK